MGFSSWLLDELKKAKGFTKDNELLAVLERVSKGVLSELKSGKRQLTDEQALLIAKECNLNVQWVLVNLNEERSKHPEIKSAWSSLAKKLSSTALALALCIGFGLGCHSGAWSGTGKVSLLRRSRYIA